MALSYKIRYNISVEIGLLALVLNINVIRFFLNISESSLLLNLIYIICIVFLYLKNKSNFIKSYYKDPSFRFYVWFWVYILGFSLVSTVVVTQDYMTFTKFLITITLALLCAGLNSKKIKLLFKYYIIINVIYGIIIFSNIQRVYNYLSGSVTYLNLTLTLGLCTTVCLVNLMRAYYRGEGRQIWGNLILSFYFLFLVLQFPARGVLLFPPVIVLIIAWLNRSINKGKFIVIILFMVLLVIGAVVYFMANATEYALHHMTQLFENTEEQSRIELWKKAIDYIGEYIWLLCGTGLNSYSQTNGIYPHNVFLQLWAEYGTVGFLGFFILTIFIIYRYVHCRKRLRDSKAVIMTFAGFLYYLFTFCKSFSLYEGLPMFIIMSICFTICRAPSRISKRKKATLNCDCLEYNKGTEIIHIQ